MFFVRNQYDSDNESECDNYNFITITLNRTLNTNFDANIEKLCKKCNYSTEQEILNFLNENDIIPTEACFSNLIDNFFLSWTGILTIFLEFIKKGFTEYYDVLYTLSCVETPVDPAFTVLVTHIVNIVLDTNPIYMYISMFKFSDTFMHGLSEIFFQRNFCMTLEKFEEIILNVRIPFVHRIQNTLSDENISNIFNSNFVNNLTIQEILILHLFDNLKQKPTAKTLAIACSHGHHYLIDPIIKTGICPSLELLYESCKKFQLIIIYKLICQKIQFDIHACKLLIQHINPSTLLYDILTTFGLSINYDSIKLLIKYDIPINSISQYHFTEEQIYDLYFMYPDYFEEHENILLINLDKPQYILHSLFKKINQYANEFMINKEYIEKYMHENNLIADKYCFYNLNNYNLSWEKSKNFFDIIFLHFVPSTSQIMEIKNNAARIEIFRKFEKKNH